MAVLLELKNLLHMLLKNTESTEVIVLNHLLYVWLTDYLLTRVLLLHGLDDIGCLDLSDVLFDSATLTMPS